MASRQRGTRSGNHLGFEDLKAESLAAIRADEFEAFCRSLLEVERFDRHTRTDIQGPQREYVADGGKDIVFNVLAPPKQSREQYEGDYGLSLTNDSGIVCYSCKSGSTWSTKVKTEASTPAGGKKKAPIDYLLEGGYFTILVNLPVGKDDEYVSKGKAKKTSPGASQSRKTIVEEVATRIWAQMKKVDPNALNPTPRIRLCDANELVMYLRRRRPLELGEAILSKLGVNYIPGLKSIDYWRHDHETERDWPEFVEDDARRQIKREVRQALTVETNDPYKRVLWIHGPPGVGKTRLLLELLSEKDDIAIALQQRTRVALSFQPGLEAIDDYSVAERFPTSVTIVDDCPIEQVGKLVSGFVYMARESQAALVILTPSQPVEEKIREQKEIGTRVLSLAPLSPEAHEELVRRELGQFATSGQFGTPGVVQRILRFSEGYPWYAILIARGWQRDPTAPLASAADAAKLALAFRSPSGNEVADEQVVLDRARCLFAAMLTENVDWDSISPNDKQGICLAVGLESWHQLDKLARECVRCGLLRMRLKHKFKYVTPLVLAREVALLLICPPDNDPRSPIGPSIRLHAAKFANTFYEWLDRLEVSIDGRESAIAAIAHEVLDELESGADVTVVGRRTLQGAPLRFSVRRAPRRAAAVFRHLVEATSVDALRELESVRRDLVWALESLSRRRVGFDDAEAALFRLACAENETYGNNATNIWGSLFLVELNPTYRTFAERLPLLRLRCTEGNSATRLVGLSGLHQAISAHVVRYGNDADDGPYERPTYQEARDAQIGAWELLLELTNDDSPEVAARARTLAVDHLRDAVRAGVGGEVARMLMVRLSRFDAKAMLALREKIEHVEAYDKKWIEADVSTRSAWTQLKAATAPLSYQERLRQRIGTWSRGGDEEDEADEAAVAALASEAIAHPGELIAELPWLDSKVAVRAPLFFIALGKSDVHGAFLNSLLDRARGGKAHDVLSGYLRGWKESGRETELDDVLRTMRSEPALAVHSALSIWRSGATEERMAWLTEDVAAGRLTDSVVGTLVLGSWERSASDDALRKLVEALSATESCKAASVGLTLAVRRLNSRDSIDAAWTGLLERLLERLTDEPQGGLADFDWGRAAKLLVRTGHIETALALALRVIGREDSRASLDHGWEAFLACVERDSRIAWRGFAPMLERGDAYRFTTALRFRGLGEAFPTDEVLAWVGRSERRAALVANLCAPYSDDLSSLARGLLIRFGPASRPAGVLESLAHSTPRATSSLAEFSQKQLRRARGWAKDPNRSVRAWAEHVVSNSMADFERHDAQEEYERRRWGT